MVVATDLDGVHGTFHVERDVSLGHYRIRLGPIKFFWKSTPGWEFNFIADDEKIGFQAVSGSVSINGQTAP